MSNVVEAFFFPLKNTSLRMFIGLCILFTGRLIGGVFRDRLADELLEAVPAEDAFE